MRNVFVALLMLATSPAIAQDKEKLSATDLTVRTALTFNVADSAVQKLLPPGFELIVKIGYTRHISARAVKTGDKSSFDRIEPDDEYDRNPRGCRLCSQRRRRAGGYEDNVYLTSNEIGRQFRQLIVSVVGPPLIFDRHVATFDKARLLEAK